MPLTEKEKEAKESMRIQYGKEKGDEIFYRMIQRGDFGQKAKERHNGKSQKTKQSSKH